MGDPPRRSLLPVLLDTAAAVYAAALVVWANATFMRGRGAMLQHWDEGYALAFARRMVEGGQNLPYVDGVSHRGPLFYWMVALAVKIYGFGTWMPMRVLTLVSMLSALALWFAAACVARRSLPGGVMALGYFAICVVGMHRPWEGPAGWGLTFNSEHMVNVFAGAALLSMTLAFPGGTSRPRFHCIGLCGACIMMSALSKQIGLLAGLPFALWAVSVAAHREDLSRRARGAIVVTFGAGLLVPLAWVVLKFAIARELGAFYYYALAYNTQVYIPAISEADRDSYVHGLFGLHHDVLLVGACLAGWGASRIFGRAPYAFFSARVPRVSEIARAYSTNAFEATVALGFILSLAGAAVGLRDFGHYYLPIVPWGGLLAGLLVERAIRDVRSKAPSRPAKVVLVRACVLLPLALIGTLGWRQRALDYATSADVLGLFDTQDWPICKFLRERTKPSDSIFIWGFDPAPYTACNRRPASRFVFTTFVSGVVPPLLGGTDAPRVTEAKRIVPGSQEQLLDDLRREKPAFVFDSWETMRDRSMMDYDPFRAFLLSNYCRDLADGRDVWERRPARGCAVRMRPLVSFWRPAAPPVPGGAGEGLERANSLTVDTDEGIQGALAAGYERSKGQQGYVFDGQQPGTTALKLYQDQRGGGWLTTASPTAERDAVASGYELVRVEGYVFTSQEAGTVPLKLLYNPALDDNLTTASAEEEAAAIRAGYTFVRTEGYVTKW